MKLEDVRAMARALAAQALHGPEREAAANALLNDMMTRGHAISTIDSDGNLLRIDPTAFWKAKP